jgi:hypothetical protein
MKTFFTSKIVMILLLICIFGNTNLKGQDVPRIISYQGVLVDATGRPVNGTKNLTFSLSPRNSAPSSPWTETINGVNISGGLFYVPLGLTNSFPVLNGEYVLVVSVDGNNYQVPLYSNVAALNIPDGIVTERKLENNAVTTSKIQDGAVDLQDLAPGINPGEILKWDGANWTRTQDEGLRTAETNTPLLGDGKNGNPVRLLNGNKDKQFLQWNQATSSWVMQDNQLDSTSYIKLSQIRIIDNNKEDFENIYIGSYYNFGIDTVYKGGAIITFDSSGTDRKVRYFASSKAGMLGEGRIYSNEFELKDSSNSFARAGIRFDNNGNPEIWSSGTKPFIVPDPTNPSRKIKYTAIEGPEAAMYHRGKIKLNKGVAEIILPDHFKALAVNESITISLTPHSLKSLGVAVDIIDIDKIRIGELQNGQGNYEVSYFISAVRKGYENYEVYQYEDKPTVNGILKSDNLNIQVNPAGK